MTWVLLWIREDHVACAMDDDLMQLKEKWLRTGSFEDEQLYLSALVQSGGSQFIFLDPDGTCPEWLVVAVRRETGVVYGTQCSGVRVELRLVEGFLVPMGGLKFDVDEGRIEPQLLNDVFHDQGQCQWQHAGEQIPANVLKRLGCLVEEITYWSNALPGGADRKSRLHLDRSRLQELAEAWIPVETPDGPGILMYKNCD